MRQTQTISAYLDSSTPTATVLPLFVADGNQLKATMEQETGGRVFFSARMLGMQLRGQIDGSGPQVDFPVQNARDEVFSGFGDALKTDAVFQAVRLMLWLRLGDAEPWRQIGSAPLLNTTEVQYLDYCLTQVAHLPQALGHRAQLGYSLDKPLTGSDWVQISGAVEESFETATPTAALSEVQFGTATASTVVLNSASEAAELVGVSNGQRKISLFHETAGEEVLIDFARDPQPFSYAFALPAQFLWFWEGWRGDIRGITRSGNAVTVMVREFEP
ncbi:MAG: hypothetical protein F6J87_18365 [Spirulina sp. SIO3F2]|nr:hypothetical protein [Spirulina sp. SIO3F2]